MRSFRTPMAALLLLAAGVSLPAVASATLATRYNTTIHPWQPVLVEREPGGAALDIVNLSWDNLGGHPPVRLTWHRSEDGVLRATSDDKSLRTNSMIIGTPSMTPQSLPTIVVYTPTGEGTEAVHGFGSPGPGGPSPGFMNRPPEWTIEFPSQGGFPEFYILNVEGGPDLEIVLRIPPPQGHPPDRLTVYSSAGAFLQELDLAEVPGVGSNITLDFADTDGDGRYEILVHSLHPSTGASQVAVIGSGLPTAVGPAAGMAGLSMTGPAPNPMGTRSTITYSIPRAGHVRVRVFDAAGRHVRTLADGVVRAGAYAHDWDGESDDGRRLPPGVYLLEVEAGSERTSRKAVLLR